MKNGKEPLFPKGNKYECINRADCWASAMLKGAMGANGLSIKYDRNKTLISCMDNSTDFQAKENERGCFIIFPTEVDSLKQSDSAIINWAKQNFKSADGNRIIGWAIGKYLNGRYKDKDGNLFGRESLSVIIVGGSSDVLIKRAECLCESIMQAAFLLKDISSDRIWLVKSNK